MTLTTNKGSKMNKKYDYHNILEDKTSLLDRLILVLPWAYLAIIIYLGA